MKYNFAPEVKKRVLFPLPYNLGIWRIFLVCITVPLGSASDTYIWDMLRMAGANVSTCRVRQVDGTGTGLFPVLLPPHCSSQWENGDFIVWFCSGPVSILIALDRELIKLGDV